jgi:hypothetical protein
MVSLERKPLGGGVKDQGDAGVAAGGLDQFLAPTQQTIAFRLRHHPCSNPAFHRISGIAPFNFRQHAWLAAGRHAVELHQRSAANAEAVVGVDRAHCIKVEQQSPPGPVQEGGKLGVGIPPVEPPRRDLKSHG